MDVLIRMCNLVKYSDNYSKKSGRLLKYYRDNSNDILTNSESFKYQIKIAGKTSATGNTKDVKVAVPLKYLSSFWRPFKCL